MSIATRDNRTISIREAARALGVSRATAYEVAKSGELAGVPVIRVGRRLLLSRDAFERVMAGNAPKGQLNAKK